jgi:hypothetical protein
MGVVVSVGLRWAVGRRLHPDVVLDGYTAIPIAQVSHVVVASREDWRAREIARARANGWSGDNWCSRRSPSDLR